MLYKLYKKFMPLLLFTIVIALLIVTPDILFAIFNDAFCVTRDPKSILFILPLSLGLALGRSRVFTAVVLIFFGILQIAQFCHISYFGTHLSPFSLHLMTKEVADVITEAKSVLWSYSYIFIIVAIPFFMIYALCVKSSKWFPKLKYRKSAFGFVMVLVLIFHVGFRLYKSEKPRFTPNEVRFSMDNSLKAFWGCWLILARDYKLKHYKPYVVKKCRDVSEPVTIVYIIGESCNANHMSLFGYDRDTTPNLNQMSKSTDFYYTRGIAGSVSTLSSSKFLFNAIREGNNVKQTALDSTNLFKLAKESGFRTFYISAQTDHILSSIGGVKYIDVLITKDKYPLQFNGRKDEFLIELLGQQTFGEKNFIAIHQCCVHSPYSETYAEGYKPNSCFSGKDARVDEYDNAMLYNDFLVSSIFKMFNKSKNKFYIFWVPDHNESMGENGLWGHGYGKLVPQTAQIPIVIQSNDLAFMEAVRQVFSITHYDICDQIIGLFGFQVTNPNQEDNVYYITGIDYNGKCGYIKFKKDKANKKVEYSNVLYD